MARIIKMRMIRWIHNNNNIDDFINTLNDLLISTKDKQQIIKEHKELLESMHIL